MLYGMTMAKLIFPLLSLPYLTRVLSVDVYGGVAFVKSLMSYIQVIVDFGFMLSGTKEVAEYQKDSVQLGIITGNIVLARLIISGFCFIAIVIFCFTMPILSELKLYTCLSFIVVVLSVFLFDYLFRGIEKMEIITIRFIIMRGITTILTFILVKEDVDIQIIPILDILASLIAIFLVMEAVKNIGIKIRVSCIKDVLNELKISFMYFVSNMATTIFGALTTVIIGSVLNSRDVAYWSVCMQLVSAVQALYTPITDSIYPEMIKRKELKIVIRLAILMFPVLFLGTIFTYTFSDSIITLIAGIDYILAGAVMKYLSPVLFLGFYTILFGWPALGAINKTKQVTLTTISSAMFQVAGIVCLALVGSFTIVGIAFVRVLTEMILMVSRGILCIKYKRFFK